MNIKSITKMLLGAAASVAMLLAANAYAGAEVYTKTGTTYAGPLTTASGTFSGSTTLTYGGLPLTCTLTLNGSVNVNTGGATGYVSITGGSVSGGGLCGTVVMSNFPWTSSTISSSALASISTVAGSVPVTINGIYVNLCGTNLSLAATFNNNITSGASPLINSAQSSFTLTNATLVGSSPTCKLNGTLTETSGKDIDVVQNP